MEQVFNSYGDKSSARRGFGRKFKELDADKYLCQSDNKWGFFLDDAGNAIRKFSYQDQPKFPDNPNVGIFNRMVGKLESDPELDAAREQSAEAPPPADDAFSRFAFSQLAEPKAPNTSLPAQAGVVVSKIERNRPESNGVKRPSAGTICAHVWDIAQKLSHVNGEPTHATLSQVVAAAMAAGINQYTARTQYARWRVFNGITGRALD